MNVYLESARDRICSSEKSQMRWCPTHQWRRLDSYRLSRQAY